MTGDCSNFKLWLERFFQVGYPEIGLEVIPYGSECYRFNLYSYNALFMEIDLFKISDGYKVEMAYLLFREGIPAFLQNLELQLRRDKWANASIYDNGEWLKRIGKFGVISRELPEDEAKKYPPGVVETNAICTQYDVKYECPWPPIYEYEDKLPPVTGSNESNLPNQHAQEQQELPEVREYDTGTKEKYQHAKKLIEGGKTRKVACSKAGISESQYYYWKNKEN